MPRTCCGPAVPTTRFQQPEAVSPLLAKILHVRRTELRRTLQVAGFAIVVGWAMYTAFSAAQSIFLNKAGPHAYPLFFIVLALTAWPMAALQGVLTRRFGVGSAFRIVLVANSVAAVAVFTAYTIREDATVAFGAYVVYSVAFELVMLNFWSFASQHFNVLEGKRIFPVIAAGSSVGYILSGFTTTIVAVFATEPLIFIWAFGALAAAVMSVGLERTLFRPAFVDEVDQLLVEHELERKRHGAIAVLRRAVEYLTGSRLVLALVLLALVLQVVSRIGDYVVAVLFVAATHNNLQALTILIGNAWLACYVVQLAVSLLLDNLVLPGAAVLSGVVLLLLQGPIASTVKALALIGIAAGVLFIAAAWRVRSLYVDAIYARLRAHALSLADFQQAVGRPTPDQIGELQGFIRGADDRTREFAAASLAKSSPETFTSMLPELFVSRDPVVRRLAFQMSPPDRIALDQLEAARGDDDGWVQAAAAVAGVMRKDRWEGSDELLHTLGDSSASGDRAAAAWAAAFVGDDTTVAGAMSDDDPLVRLEAIRSFARMKGQVAGVADALLACLRDSDVGVRREALRQAVRWTPPAAVKQAFAEALADCLASGDRDVRRVAAEAM